MEPVTYRIEEVTNPERTATMERVLLTAEEVGEALHIGRTRVYELLAAGEITSVKIGHLRHIPVDAVREYAARLVEEVAV